MKKNISKIDKRRAIPLIAILALNNTILNSQDNMTVRAQCEAENRIINMVLYLLDDTLNEEDVDYYLHMLKKNVGSLDHWTKDTHSALVNHAIGCAREIEEEE
jgi:hypothetical protein